MSQRNHLWIKQNVWVCTCVTLIIFSLTTPTQCPCSKMRVALECLVFVFRLGPYSPRKYRWTGLGPRLPLCFESSPPHFKRALIRTWNSAWQSTAYETKGGGRGDLSLPVKLEVLKWAREVMNSRVVKQNWRMSAYLYHSFIGKCRNEYKVKQWNFLYLVNERLGENQAKWSLWD